MQSIPYDIPLDSSRYLTPSRENDREPTFSPPDPLLARITDCTVSTEVSKLGSAEKMFPVTDIFGERSPLSDPIETFVRDKLIIIEASIKQVLEEIEQREDLLAALLEDIDIQIGVQKEMFHRVAPFGTSILTQGDPKRRVAIEKTLASLEVDRRKEQSGAWKDIASLKKELRELVREYNEERRKQRVVGP